MNFRHIQGNQMILIYDGECILCHHLIRLVLKFDKQEIIKLAHIQSVNIAHDAKYPTETITLALNGQMYHKSDAVKRVMSMIGFPFNAISSLMQLFPTSILDSMYDFVAKNRDKWPRYKAKCPIIDDNIRRRLYHELDPKILS